jgi:Fic-DOC domain mobile mystery protein B
MKLAYEPGATPLDPEEAQALIPTSVSTMAELNEFEQANILEAQEWALGSTRTRPLSEEFVRTLHRRMFQQVWRWAGTYRKSNKNIGIDWSQIPSEVKKLCDDTRYWVENKTYEWNELGARFHHRLVSIHPFPNGNGRHARLLTDVLLQGNRRPLFSWGSKSDLAKDGPSRNRYISALREADQKRFAALVEFVCS